MIFLMYVKMFVLDPRLLFLRNKNISMEKLCNQDRQLSRILVISETKWLPICFVVEKMDFLDQDMYN